MEFEVLSQFLIFYYIDLIWGCSIFKSNDFYQSICQTISLPKYYFSD